MEQPVVVGVDMDRSQINQEGGGRMTAPMILEETIVYLHVPKTGGTFITSLFKDYYRTREDPGEFRSQVVNGSERAGVHSNGNWIPLPKICMIREPLSWLLSWWGYWSERPWAKTRTEDRYCGGVPRSEFDERFSPAMVDFTELDDFTKTSEKLISNHPGFISSMFRHYSSVCDRVFIFPEFKTMSPFLRFSLGQEPPSFGGPPKNSRRRKRRPKISRSLLREIVELESEVYDVYNLDPRWDLFDFV